MFSSSPTWYLKTVGNVNNCGHLGLKFGRNENLLYAFSRINAFSTIILLDIHGNSLWQYATHDGSSTHSNFIEYKAIDANTDMILTTNVDSYINFNRIVSSATTPFSILPAYTYTYYPTAPIYVENHQFCGLFIKDLNFAYALISTSIIAVASLAMIDFSAF
jgi:hypothetical protein